MPDQTQPMPPAQPPHPQGPPAPGAGQAAAPAGPGGPGAPVGPTQPPHGGWPPPGQPQQPYGPPPERRPGMWRQATATTGGKVATGIAIALAGLLLLGVLVVGVVGVSRAVGLWGDHGQRVSQRDDWGPGGRLGEGNRMGPGMGPRSGLGNGQGNLQGNGLGGLRGNGVLGQLGRVQHGELTVTGADGKAVVMTVQRGTVTAASATSVSVRSDDGYAQTYAVNSSTRVRGTSGAQPQKDDQVVVLARKADKVATQIRVVGR